jgi:hypothetical protein
VVLPATNKQGMADRFAGTFSNTKTFEPVEQVQLIGFSKWPTVHFF